MAHIKRGDTVVVTKGREKGKQGKVKRVLLKKDRQIGRASCRERV